MTTTAPTHDPARAPITDARALEVHRAALTGHCYRMLGALTEAEDAVQDTLVRAWRARDRYEGRASVRTWLTRIATRVCLDALAARKRRAVPMDLGPAGGLDTPITTLPADRWIQPIPDALALPPDLDPAERLALRQSVRLAFVAALQRLAPRQRAALLLHEVLDWPAAQVADALDTSVAATNSLLQRARARLSEADLPPAAPEQLTADHAALVQRFVDAFERYDVARLALLLREDATMAMPPIPLWLRGRADISAFFLGPGAGCRGSRLFPVEACGGAPAFAQYHPKPDGQLHAWALVVLELGADRVDQMMYFLDVETVFPRFGLPLTKPA